MRFKIIQQSLTFLFLFTFSTMHAQENTPIITGVMNDTLFQTEWYAQWNDAKDYQPNSEVLNKLSELPTASIQFMVYLGTWCEDSRKHVPVFLDLARRLNWKYSLVGVNREKECPLDKKACKAWDILYLPTIVVFRDGVELGRIIETPKISVEQDLLDILRK